MLQSDVTTSEVPVDKLYPGATFGKGKRKRKRGLYSASS